jgi:hypothetical protein
MERFVHKENLRRLRIQLAQTSDETTRQQLSKLLAEEEAKYPEPSHPEGSA